MEHDRVLLLCSKTMRAPAGISFECMSSLIQMKLLSLTRDGPPLVMCSPFRLGQPPKTNRGAAQHDRVLLLLFGNRESSSRDQLRMHELGIEMELLWLTRDGPPLVLRSPFRLGQPPKTNRGAAKHDGVAPRSLRTTAPLYSGLSLVLAFSSGTASENEPSHRKL